MRVPGGGQAPGYIPSPTVCEVAFDCTGLKPKMSEVTANVFRSITKLGWTLASMKAGGLISP